MQNKQSTAVAVTTNESLESFRQGVDNLLAKRSYFVSKILPMLKEDSDYYLIKGRRSLSKGGAEKLCAIYNLTATFEKDRDAMEAFAEVRGFISFVCTLTRNGQVAGQGRGGDTLARNQNDANKTIKMAQKRAFVDAVIRSTGLSDIFTQDMEDMPDASTAYYRPERGSFTSVKEIIANPAPVVVPGQVSEDGDAITHRQRNLLLSLIEQKVSNDDEKREMMDTIDAMDKRSASELIQELLTTSNY